MKLASFARIMTCALTAALVLLNAGAAFGGGPLRIHPGTGKPVVWPNGGRNIVYHTDLGGLGPMTNSDAVAQTNAAFAKWQAVPTATASFIHGGSLGIENETNFVPYLFGRLPDGLNPVVYDETGAIFDLLFGPGAGILGFAGVDRADGATGEILEALIFINGNIDFQGSFGSITAADVLAVQVHEIGHFMGLDHTVVNIEALLMGDTTGPTPHDTFLRPPSVTGKIETMFPFFVPGAGCETPGPDDRAIFSALYPTPQFFAGSGTITGRVVRSDGLTPANGVNVIARNLADPFGDAVSSISGSFASGGAADPLAGVYRLHGLTPGAQYAVYIDEVFFGEFSVRPMVPLSGPEEFYNGVSESDNFTLEDPTGEFTPLTALAGHVLTGIDIVFNRIRPGPIPIDVFTGGDRARPWVELPLPFPFHLCGERFNSVFLNMTEGNLTFGQPDFRFFAEKAFKVHLLGPPRISGLLLTERYLDPYVFPSSAVAFDQTADTLTITYADVPSVSFDGTPRGRNSFAMTLHGRNGGKGNRVTLAYGALDIENAVVGYSCGGRVTSGFETESDLSTLADRPVRGTAPVLAEEFVNFDIDLRHRTLIFEMPDGFSDRYEPNDSLHAARRVTLPFHTANDFVDLRPGDVDVYRFRVKAGELIVAETVPGSPLDTVIGLFGPDHSLLEVNDNAAYLFSRIIYRAPADGEYMLAVTTYPDDSFTGGGGGSGRYVLTINAFKGTILPLDGDDVAVEMPLPFAFRFQGHVWRSAWINSNGSITFGAPEPANVVEDVQIEGFLGGPPRIAPFFADLDPSGTYNGLQGLIMAEQKTDSFTVHWVSVPRLLDWETNTFSVTLHSDGQITMDWGATSTEDWLRRGTIVGLSEGGVAAVEPTDLSRSRPRADRGTTYEQFAVAAMRRGRFVVDASNIQSFDLSFSMLRFTIGDPKKKD